MVLLATYLFWINVLVFVIMAHDRHNAFYGRWRFPQWLFILLACLGGLYGYLLALLLLGRDKSKSSSPIIPWGKKDLPYVTPRELPVDNSPVPGWGGTPIDGPGLPSLDDNKPTLPDPSDVINPSPGDTPIRLVCNEIIVVFNTDYPERDMSLFNRRFRQLYSSEDIYKVSYYNTSTRLMHLRVPASERVSIMDCIERELGEELDFFLTDNYVFSDKLVPLSPGFKMSDVRRYYEEIQAPEAWDITQGSPNVTVAIVDTCFALDHPDLKDRWRDPINIVTHTRNVLPPAGCSATYVNHGTHVAGIAVGGCTGRGASGMAPNCRWIPISLGSPIYSMHMLEGVLYAIYKGADVVNVSLGAVFDEIIFKLPVDEQFDLVGKSGQRLQAVWEYVTRVARERKCVIVWSAGNENALIALDAAKRSDDTIKVSAIEIDGSKASFSNFGNYYKYNSAYSTLSAPGVGILSCVGNGEYAKMDGTSMAAPFVTGAVALMKSLDRSLSPREVIDILTETGHKTSPEDHIGPIIQVRDALLRVKRGLANFEDVTRDNESLLGGWEATEHLLLVNHKDEYLDDILIFFRFNSTSEGKLTLRSVNLGDVYEAHLRVALGKKKITITQMEEAVCIKPGVKPIRAYIYECAPDADGLLFCKAVDKENGSVCCSFRLRKFSE